MMLDITMKEIGEGKRRFELTIGSRIFQVDEIFAPNLTQHEINEIQKARESYLKMWGNGAYVIKEDAFDNFHSHRGHLATHHYIARVISPGEPTRIVTMRKVALATDYPHGFSEYGFPDDVVMWTIVDNEGSQSPLWKKIKIHLQGLGYNQPEMEIAAISRTGVWPFEVEGRTTELQRETTAIAFSLIQCAAKYHDSHALWICQLCDEFRTRVHTLTVDGQVYMLDFSPSAQELGLPPDLRIILDKTNPEVWYFMTHFPGYWKNNAEAASFFKQLISEGKLLLTDLIPAVESLLAGETRRAISGRFFKEAISQDLLDEDILEDLTCNLVNSIYNKVFSTKDPSKVIEILVSSRNFKHLIPLINSPGMINQRLSGEELRKQFIQNVADGPYSSLFKPDVWVESAKRLLFAAKQKYDRGWNMAAMHDRVMIVNERSDQ